MWKVPISMPEALNPQLPLFNLPADGFTQPEYPSSCHHCQEVAAFHVPTSGRNLASCRYLKPLSLSAMKVSPVIRKSQPRAEACLESISSIFLRRPQMNNTFLPCCQEQGLCPVWVARSDLKCTHKN